MHLLAHDRIVDRTIVDIDEQQLFDPQIGGQQLPVF
jgi:hypothetical protein